jgi:hypothetical protein
VIKPRKLRWTGHVALVGRAELHTGFWWGNLEEEDHLEDPGVDSKIKLKYISRT